MQEKFKQRLLSGPLGLHDPLGARRSSLHGPTKKSMQILRPATWILSAGLHVSLLVALMGISNRSDRWSYRFHSNS